ncbi:MAG: sulfotransferase family 2 domain-containing protein [Chloroflexota bacterium]
MPLDPQPDHVIFLHIPKTAGSTLYRILERHYHFSQIYTIWQSGTLAEFNALPAEKKQTIKLLRGHAGYGTHEQLPGRSAYFTILRNPSARVVSYYHFIRRTPHHYCHHQIIKNQWTLPQFLENKADPMADNAQTRLLAGLSSGQEVPFGTMTEAHLQRAKTHLREMAVVGLTERFDETLFLLKDVFSWQKLHYARQNVTNPTKQSADLAPETLEALQKVNHFDWALYDYAETLLEEQLDNLGPDWPERIAQFQKQNERLRPLTNLLFNSRKYSVRTAIKRMLGNKR